MKAGCSQLKPRLLILICTLCIYTSLQSTAQQLQVCKLCDGPVRNGSAVGQFCSSSAGQIDGRCCLRHDNTSEPERIIGLDLSNCSLTHVDELQGASTAVMIDFSLNSVVNISDSAFKGFTDLNYVILPPNLLCPGGITVWERTEIKGGNRLCEGQKSMCNQTGQLSADCPEFSLCSPFGPGFFECACADKHHGYKCLREGEFPVLQVFGPLGACTVVISLLLWVTQRRKAKSL